MLDNRKFKSKGLKGTTYHERMQKRLNLITRHSSITMKSKNFIFCFLVIFLHYELCLFSDENRNLETNHIEEETSLTTNFHYNTTPNPNSRKNQNYTSTHSYSYSNTPRYNTSPGYFYTTARPNSFYTSSSYYTTSYNQWYTSTIYYQYNYWNGNNDLNDSLAMAFDWDNERCCGGEVYEKRPNDYQKCCGNTEYDSTYQTCCSGVVYDIKKGHVCCGTEFFSIKEAICCFDYEKVQSKLITFKNDVDEVAVSFSQCCGSATYDTRTEICCLHGKDKLVGYNPYYYHCSGKCDIQFTVHKIIDNKTSCCEGKPYDQSKEDCRGGGVAPTPPVPQTRIWTTPSYQIRSERTKQLCNGTYYNPDQEICCSLYNKSCNSLVSKLQEKNDYSFCCGLSIYNIMTQICCGQLIFSQNENHTMRCCGNNTYNTETEICCDFEGGALAKDKLSENQTNCCGKKQLPYNSTRQFCCGDGVFDRPALTSYGNPEMFCCWNGSDQYSLYNVTNQSCCGGQTYNRYQNLNCCGNKQVYNTTTSQCCNGRVHSISTSCCGEHSFNYTTQICCGNNVYLKNSTMDACCGDKGYNFENEICCGSRTQPKIYKKENFTQCCGLEVYDVTTEMCCSSYQNGNWLQNVVKKLSNNSGCCGKNSFNVENEICCNDTVVSKIVSDASCCGSSAYDRKSQMCCRNIIHEKGDRKNPQCCGGKAFDFETEICCRGAVVKGGRNKICCTSDYPN